MFAWQTEACLSSGLSPVRALNRSLYRMLHNLLAHNSPIGTEPGTARSRSRLWHGGRALLFFLLMDSVPPTSPCLNTQQGDGDACSLRAVSIKRRKLIMVSLGAEQERKKQALCGHWASGTVLGDGGTSPPSVPHLLDRHHPSPTPLAYWRLRVELPFSPSGKGCSFSSTRL